MIDTTPGRMKLAALLPHHPQIGHRLVAKALTKKEIGNLIDAVYRHCGQKATVIFADQIMGLGFKEAARAGISFGKDDIVIPERKKTLVEETRTLAKEYEQQYADGLITRGEKYNKVVDAWAKATDRVADEMMGEISQAPTDENGRELEINSIYMMAHSGARGLAGPDEAARRHARPDGQAVRRDHRDADHLQLQGRPDRAGVLQLHPRRPQGPGRHRPEDGELGLPDPPPGGRGAGLHHHRGGLRHHARHHHPRGGGGRRRARQRSASASWAVRRPRT